MKFSPEAERQFCHIYNKMRQQYSTKVGNSARIIVQLKVEVGDSPDTTTIAHVLPLICRDHDGTTKLIGDIARADRRLGISTPEELSPPQTCGEQYNNP